jgi:hypothetical protein
LEASWASILAIAGAVYAAFQPPDVIPSNDVSGGSSVLPFQITNGSYLFSMRDVRMSCDVDSVTYLDNRGHRFGAGGFIPDTDAQINEISPRSPVGYTCDASPVLKTGPDGSISIGILRTLPNVTASELRVEWAWVRVFISYRTLWFRRAVFISPPFEWVPTRTGHQWFTGTIIDKKALPCREEVTGPFGRLLPDGQILLQLEP